MWVVVYEDLNLGYKKASKVFDTKGNALSHFYRLEKLRLTDPSIGIMAIGVYKLTSTKEN